MTVMATKALGVHCVGNLLSWTVRALEEDEVTITPVTSFLSNNSQKSPATIIIHKDPAITNTVVYS